MADNDAAVEAAIRGRQSKRREDMARWSSTYTVGTITVDDVDHLLTTCDSLRAARDVLRKAVDLLEGSNKNYLRIIEEQQQKLVAKAAERDSLREALNRAVREGRHGPMCDRARCVCWKTEARAALAKRETTTQEVGDGK